MERVDLKEKTIVVTNVLTDLKKVTIEAGKDKYSFFMIKKDGSETKAYEQFKAMDIQVNSQINIAYAEEDQEFTNEQGKLIKYKRRTIMYFPRESSGNYETTARPSTPTPQSDSSLTSEKVRVAFEKRDQRIDALSTSIEALENRIVGLELLVDDLMKK